MAPVELTKDHQPAPGCYRHPDRKTYVSCGRCGKPLCPDCMRFGPVGIRCQECLHPSSNAVTMPTVAIDINIVRNQAIIFAVIGMLLIAIFSVGSTEYLFGQSKFLLIFPPNPLVSALAGGIVGWRIWHNSGKVYNMMTIKLALILGAAIPILASLLIMTAVVVTHSTLAQIDLAFAMRTLFAVVFSTFFCWFLATQQHN